MVHRGLAYEPYMRDNVIRLHCAGWSNASIAEYFHQRPCERTVQEWVQRFKEAPHLGAPAPLPKPGPAPMLSQRDAYGLWAAKCAMPTLSIGAAQQFIFLLSGKFPSPSTVSREVVQRLCMSRKLLTHVSTNRDEDDRTAFWTRGPLDAVRPGVFGVPSHVLVSVDEKTIKYGDCVARYGHSPAGTPAVQHGPAPSSQLAYNVILATDIRVGCVTYLIYRGALNRDTFYSWVALQV